MKKLATVLLLFTSGIFSAGLHAQTATRKAKKSAAKKTTAPAARQAEVITIPKGAVLGEDGSYHFTDKNGKKLVYRNTPFGVARAEDKPAAQPVQGPELTRATVVGDTVRFERPNAFGISRWEKKTSELTDDEKKVLESQKAKQ